MQPFPETVIIRHKRENLKKCSLRGLEEREDLHFLRYPLLQLPPLEGYVMLSLTGEPLSAADADKGILLLDGTWRWAEKMYHFVEGEISLPKRTLPTTIVTAYPRKQEDCPDPSRGLASVEALYAAYRIIGRDTKGLLDHYHWKEEFISRF